MLFDIVDQKSLKVLDDRIKDLYLNQKSGSQKEFIHHNVHDPNISEDLMEVEESGKYLWKFFFFLQNGVKPITSRFFENH